MTDYSLGNSSGGKNGLALFPPHLLFKFPNDLSGLGPINPRKLTGSERKKQQADFGQTLPLLDTSDFSGPEPSPRVWTLHDYVPANETTLLTGPGGVGKSLFGQQFVTCVAAGLAFLSVPTSGTIALYVSCEDDFDELTRRQQKICRAIGQFQLEDRLHLSSLRGLIGNELCEFDVGGKLSPTDRFYELAYTINKVQADVVVLDHLGHFFIGNENDRGEVTQFVNLLNKLAQDANSTIVLLGHPNKSGDSYSGSTAWLNAVRSQIELSWGDDKGSMPGTSDTRRLTLGKANYARRGTTLDFRWHQSAFVLDSDLSDKERRSLASRAQEVADDELFLECLRVRNEQRRAVSENRSPSYAPTEFCKMPEAKRIGKDRFEQAMNRLFATKRIERACLWKNDGRKDVFGLREVKPTCS